VTTTPVSTSAARRSYACVCVRGGGEGRHAREGGISCMGEAWRWNGGREEMD